MPVGQLLLMDRAIPQLLERDVNVKFLLIDDQSDRQRAARCCRRSNKPWLIKGEAHVSLVKRVSAFLRLPL